MHTTPFRHPLATHSALDVLGHRRNGSPIYAIAGGNGAGEGGSGGTPPGAPPAGNQPPATPPAVPPVQPPVPPVTPPPNVPGKVEDLPDWAQKLIKDANAGEAKARTVAKENAAKEARAELLRQLSGDAEKPLTPEQLTQQLQEAQNGSTTAQQEALAARVELQVHRIASRLGANAEQLLDSRSFVDAIDSLDVDPTDTKAFTAAVEKHVNEALENNASLRMGQAPRRGGGDFAGRPGTDGRPTSLGQAVAASLAGG